MAEQNAAVDLTSGSIWNNIWHMSWSMLIVMLFNFLVGITDIYVAGFLGPEIQAVVGFVGELYFFIIIVANAISVGAVAMLSRAVGSGNLEKAMTAARQSLLFGALCAVALMIAGLLFYKQLILLAGFSESIGEKAGEFFVIFTLALLPNYIVIISNSIFRSGGEVRLTLVAMFFVSLINIGLDYILVFGLFSFDGIGFIGIAVSTAVSMTVGMIICIMLFTKSRWSGIFSGPWNISARLIGKIFAISWPMALLQVSWNAGNIVLYNILGRLHEGSITAMAAFTSGLRIEALIYMPIFALNMAASVLTGQNLGAGAPERAEKIGWKIACSGVAFVSLMSLLIYIWADHISSPIARDSHVLEETVLYLRIMMFSEPLMALSLIMGGCLQGAGDTKGVMAVIVSTLWIVRLPLAYVLAVNAGYGALGVWIAMVVSMYVQGSLMTLRFRRGRWKLVSV